MSEKEPYNRKKERTEFLTKHLDDEINRLCIEYLTEMRDIDRQVASAHLMTILVNKTAFTLGIFTHNKEEWRELVDIAIRQLKEHEEYIPFDGTSYISLNESSEYER